MAKPLTDELAVRICRSHQPSKKDMVRVMEWAKAQPAADKVAPLLVLFSEWWAQQHYPGPESDLCRPIADCALLGGSAIWQCIERDFDTGRVAGAVRVCLHARDAAQRLPRLLDLVRSGRLRFAKDQILSMADHFRIPVPEDLRRLPPAFLESQYFEECRADWPAERDRLPLGEQLPERVISDEEAHALSRKFQPSAAEIRKVLDWAMVRGASEATVDEVLRAIVVLATGYQLNDEWPRWMEVAVSLAKRSCTAMWEVLEGDWEYSRLFAAAAVVSQVGDAKAMERMAEIYVCSQCLPAVVKGDIVKGAGRTGAVLPEVFRPAPNGVAEQVNEDALARRRDAWPAERDRFPRPRHEYLIEGRRPEEDYPSAAGELTGSLDRIRAWLDQAGLALPPRFRPGLTQQQIAAQVRYLPGMLTGEMCELYRWANGADGGAFLVLLSYFDSLEATLENGYWMMRDLSDQQDTVKWKKEWFPFFQEGHFFWIQPLQSQAAESAPVMEYYLVDAKAERRYRSLTEMMAVWADCYEGGGFEVKDGVLCRRESVFDKLHGKFLRRYRAGLGQ